MIFRAWKNRLKSLKPEHQVEVYQTLTILRLEYDSNTFEDQMAKFVRAWVSSEPEFVQYFNTNYANRAGIM